MPVFFSYIGWLSFLSYVSYQEIMWNNVSLKLQAETWSYDLCDWAWEIVGVFIPKQLIENVLYKLFTQYSSHWLTATAYLHWFVLTSIILFY
jgi:hypothetical protein